MDPNRAEAYVYIWEIVYTNSTANATTMMSQKVVQQEYEG